MKIPLASNPPSFHGLVCPMSSAVLLLDVCHVTQGRVVAESGAIGESKNPAAAWGVRTETSGAGLNRIRTRKSPAAVRVPQDKHRRTTRTGLAA